MKKKKKKKKEEEEEEKKEEREKRRHSTGFCQPSRFSTCAYHESCLPAG